ncbi:hypothetical protein B0H19DRAFT_380195, partial [Mycena capillaripes]
MSHSPTPAEAPSPEDAPNSGETPPLEQTVVPENDGCSEASHELPDEDVKGLIGALINQSASLKTAVENLTQTVEAFKGQHKSPDKKIAFWTAYKKLADEFDAELQGKYGQDLDTTLIFAGLFSAVSSAFIIQIQPELQPDPTQVLFTVFLQNITGLPSSQLPPGVSTSQNMTLAVVVTQGLLYSSLFATLLAALLAVLAKQWLLHYNSVGERGTIAERGVERQ